MSINNIAMMWSEYFNMHRFGLSLPRMGRCKIELDVDVCNGSALRLIKIFYEFKTECSEEITEFEGNKISVPLCSFCSYSRLKGLG